MNPRWLWVGLFAALLVYLSLFPYNFDFARHLRTPAWRWPDADGDWVDAALNFFAYLPLGLLLRPRLPFPAAAALAFTLSLAIELLQAFLPSRDSSLRDLLLNTLGGAAGWLLFGFLPGLRRRSLAGISPILRSRLAAFAWALWLIWVAAPLVPVLRSSQLQILRSAILEPEISWERVCTHALVFAILLQIGGIERWRAALLAFVGLCYGALTLHNRFDYSDLVALFLGIGLSHWSWRPLAALFVSVLAWNQFRGIGAAPPPPFSWWPLSGFTSLPIPVLRVIAGKILLYGSAIFALTRAGTPLKLATLSIAALLAAGEVAQTLIPGRTPEVTDPLLALAIGFLFHHLARNQQSSPSRPAP